MKKYLSLILALCLPALLGGCGGDGTILHSSKIATEHNLPILGVNIGTMGFIAELEAGEIELLRKIPKGDYTV